MRRISLGLVCALVVAWSVGAEGATITGTLVDITPGAVGPVHSIAIYLKTDVPNGIASAEMEILSAGTGKANFGTQSGATVANSTIVTTASGSVAASQGYSFVKPNLSTDGSPDTSGWYPNPVVGAALDGDFDAVGFSVFATPGSVDSDPNDHAALGQTQTGYGDLVGIEKWVFNASLEDPPVQLNLYLAFATYFSDSSGGTASDNPAFPAANYVTFSLNAPEPASFALLGLGGLGLWTTGKARRKNVL